MSELKGTQTEKDLKEAFAGESQANRKYLAFAQKAEQEGHDQVARLFRAVAAAETIHAHAHFRLLKGVGSTEENLMAAMAGESEEFTKMYPGMMKTAEEAGFTAALRSLTFANEVEKIHHDLFENALNNLGQEGSADYYVCQVCGHTMAGKPGDPCPVCGASPEAYFKVD
jgi:rubrerythrin